MALAEHGIFLERVAEKCKKTTKPVKKYRQALNLFKRAINEGVIQVYAKIEQLYEKGKHADNLS